MAGTAPASKVPPPPRRLTPLGLKRLRREFAYSRGDTAFFTALFLFAVLMRVVASGALDDLRLEFRHDDAVGITSIAPSTPESPPYSAFFRFIAADGTRVGGRSFTDDETMIPPPLAEVAVEYDPLHPARNRIAGMRSGHRSWRAVGSYAAVLLVAMFAATVAVQALFRRLNPHRRRLCENGQVAVGRLLRQNWLDVLLFRRRLSRAPCRYTALNFHFRDAAGRSHKGRAITRRAPQPLEPGDEVTVIYDPLKPRRSICVEALGLEFVPAADETGSQDQHDPFRPAAGSCCKGGR